MSIVWFGLGAVAWSGGEYALHRFIGHGPKRRPAESLLGMLTPAGFAAEFNREHLAHHADPSYFAPTSRKALVTAAALPAMSVLLTPVLGPRRALSFSAGFLASYLTYEILHRRIHTHPPRNAYGRWMRRHHLLHHHASPRANHGVTSPLWDRLFSTLQPPERVRIPRRSPPDWLLDPDTGAVRAEHAEEYELVGKPAREAYAV